MGHISVKKTLNNSVGCNFAASANEWWQNNFAFAYIDFAAQLEILFES